MHKLLVVAALAALVGAGCSAKPIPRDRLDYVGQWQGVGVTLTITADGGLDYRRVSGSGHTSVAAPVQEFRGDDFVAGIAFLSTAFKVTSRPHREGDVWKMTVDGVELTRVAP